MRTSFRLSAVATLSAVLLLAGCSDESSSSPCEGAPYAPAFELRTFNADTIELGAAKRADCSVESFDTTHLSARVEGWIEADDGSRDSVWFHFIEPRWLVRDGRVDGLLWTAPADGIRHLRGVRLNVFGVAAGSGDLVGFEAVQDSGIW